MQQHRDWMLRSYVVTFALAEPLIHLGNLRSSHQGISTGG